MGDRVPQLEDLGDLQGRSVLLRADFNVPIRDGEVVDYFRIRATLPTIEWLTSRGATVTTCSHLGRPKGKPDPKYSMEPVRAVLRELAPGEKDENVVLEFRPDADEPMLVACLWSHWTGAGQPDLLSFAAITDEPPPEVSAAGHDRCIVPIKSSNVEAWLSPSQGDLQRQYEILDDRERPYYAHRLAA